VESILHLFGIIGDDAVLLDMLKPALDILNDDLNDEIIEGLSYFLVANS